MKTDQLPTVAKLIEQLQRLPQDKVAVIPVKNDAGHWTLFPITKLEQPERESIVWDNSAVHEVKVIILR